MARSKIDHDLLHLLVGRKIAEERGKTSLTQAKLADAVGLTRTSVTNIEKGRQRISLQTLFEIAAALGREPVQFLPTRQDVTAVDADRLVPDTVSEGARVAIESIIKKFKKG